MDLELFQLYYIDYKYVLLHLTICAKILIVNLEGIIKKNSYLDDKKIKCS